MKAKILLTACLLVITCSHAKVNESLSASNIPEKLKEHAHAVLRYSHTELTVEALDKVIYKRKYAITILDEKGKIYAPLHESYNQLVKINDIEGRLFDAQGNEIQKLKERDITDVSTFGMSFVYHSDSRIKHHEFQSSSYPYTIEYEIEEELKTTFFLPDWHTQLDNDYAIETTDFTLAYPVQSAPVKYKEYLMPKDVEKTMVQKDYDVITWKLKDIAAYEKQPQAKVGNYEAPTIVLAPEEFELFEYKGNMASWKSLGDFMYKLNENRDVLPEDKKAVVHSLISGETDTYQKIQKLYAYMQQNTRYIANEYGISGWQTFDAKSVADNGYGDCKGLTNYLKALLKEAGINAYTALVYAGDDFYKLDESFPSNTFNHVILCVPQPKDSIWVECTSQQLPAGYLGSFTQGRKVLLATENGGYVCETPSYKKDKNYIIRKASLQLDNTSKQQKITLQNEYHGLMQDDIEAFIKTQPEDEVRKMVNSKFAFPSYSVSSYAYKHIGSKVLPAIEEKVETVTGGIISSTQKRTFINVAWMRNPMPEIFQASPRTLPFALNESFKITDTISIDIGAGVAIEAMPKATDLKHPFAEYHLSFEKKDNKILMIRTYEQNAGVYSAADFDKYQEMYNTIKGEKEKLSIVLLNKPT